MTLAGGAALGVSLLAAVALAAATGLRAFLPLLVLSVAARLGVVTLHENVRFLESDVALVALAVATLLELAADKIPVVDHLLDAAATFVRPAAAFVAGLALLADLPDSLSVALALVLAVIALGTHLERAKTRAGSTVLTGGLANPLLSTLEDFLAAALSVLAVLAPLLAALLVVGTALLVRRLWKRRRRRAVA
jgi:hypothetical protein